MSRRATRRGGHLPSLSLVVVLAFAAGVAAGWALRAPVSTPVRSRSADVPLLPDSRPRDAATGTSGRSAPDRAPSLEPAAPAFSALEPIAALRAKRLRLPIDHADVSAMRSQFDQPRDGGARGHEAVDILAPRNTPVHAVEDGTIAKLFHSRQGGLTVYQFDPQGRFCYYYAHLDRYAEGLEEGQPLKRGDVVGYVGTTGNAPVNTPHLHFAIFALTPEHHWWQGTPLDPWLAFSPPT